MPRVIVVEDFDASWMGCRRMYVDDVELKNITGINMEILPGEISKFEVSMCGFADIDTIGDVNISFCPQTVVEAVSVMRKQLMNDMELRKGFLASIMTALRENEGYPDNAMANKILERLIGEE